jgi:glycosyltransferase involved in cell wall biosynthesis
MKNNKKNLALYHPWIYLKGGAERVILEIASRSKHEWTLFTNHYDSENTFKEFKNLNVIELEKVSVRRAYNIVASTALRVISQKVDLSAFDALLISSEGLGDFFTLRNHSQPTYCFCHTPLKVIHDPITRNRYIWDKKSVIPKYIISSTLFKIVDKIAWSHYRKVICNSNETKKRVLRARLAPKDRIIVNHPGVDLDKLRPSWRSDKYFLIPGRIVWYKNISMGVDAFKTFEKCTGNKEGFKLVIAGMVDAKSQDYVDDLEKRAEDSDNIEFVKDPTDEELFKLYRNCYSVLFTSLNEDWGIVPLEAMAFGKPVISINRGGPTESIVDGKTGFLVEATIEELCNKITTLTNDPEMVMEMGKNSREHVANFSVQSFVEKIDSIFQEL